jgi:hypothetical protein
MLTKRVLQQSTIGAKVFVHTGISNDLHWAAGPTG